MTHLGSQNTTGRRLASCLALRHAGRPIVVIGGGPSAPWQWDIVRKLNPVTLSANGHAAKLGIVPDYIMCKDHRHSETKKLMEDELRPIGAPIIGPHWWADYRMVNFPSQGNSGLLAIAFAVFMGGQPVIPIGIDCYQGQTYFHGHNDKNVSHGRHEATWRHTLSRLHARVGDGAAVRALSGILTQSFKRYDPAETFGSVILPAAMQKYRDQRETLVRAAKPGFGPPVGCIYPMEAEEARRSTLIGSVVDFTLTV